MANSVLHSDLVGVQRSSVQHWYERMALFVGRARPWSHICFLGGRDVHEKR